MENIVNNYLYFGYLPPKNCPIWLSKELLAVNEFDHSPQGAGKVFDKLFNDLLLRFSNKRHVVPLSGGWDSRAILGALMDRMDGNMIETVTFGTNGQLDFDLGIKIARWAGLKYHAIDLKDIKFDWESILISVKESPWTYVPDGFFNSYSRIKYSDDQTIVWSGFLGDPLAGSHLIDGNPNLIAESFIKKQKRIAEGFLVQEKEFRYDLTSYKLINSDLCFDDILDLAIRQSYCIAPIVLPLRSFDKLNNFISQDKNGAEVVAPFASEANIKYWLTAPRCLRSQQNLYLNMLNLKFPALFELPNKYSLGERQSSRIRYKCRRYSYGLFRQLERNVPWLGIRNTSRFNYLDYDTMFRKRKDYKETLTEAFSFLKTNGITPWLSFDQLWTNHMKMRANYGEAFCVLIGLAANLVMNFNDEPLDMSNGSAL